MNVLFLDSIERETYGGMEEWIRLIARGLAARTHKITVAGRPDSEFLRRVSTSAPEVAVLPLDISGDFNPATIAAIHKYLARHEVDIISVNFNKDVRLGGLAARLDRSTRVVWSVGLDITKDNWIHKFLTPKLVDGVIVPSEALKGQICRPGYIRDDIVRVIPIGIPDTSVVRSPDAGVELRKKYELPDDAVVAVTSGRLVDQKGHRYLIEAAPRMLSESPNLFFLWLGDGPLEEDLRRRIAGLDLAERFVLAGMLDGLDLELAGADMLIHPSIEEPFGISVLEAMRAGLPVVASRVGGIPEVVGDDDCALLVEPKESDSLAEAVTTLAGDQSLRDDRGRRARARYLEHFTVERMLDGVESYFGSMLQTEQCRGKA